jgi:DEAD/DEAH box helicase domain-containing protein
MESLLSALREFDALRDTGDSGDQIHVRTVEAVAPIYADAESLKDLPEHVLTALSALNIRRLYRHQAEAIRLALQGEDLVLESPTASGKTLCFVVPMAMRLLQEPGAHALMIHPMKALSNDQRRQFEEFATALKGSGTPKLESWIFDGDTEQEVRSLIKSKPPQLLLTNPEMLHRSFLGWSQQWEPFLRGLRMVVIDEIHEYRGYFGTNMALLLRRFLSRLHQLGSRPQLILASATCHNPVEHAERLTGRPFRLVRSANVMRPTRHFAFIAPRIPDFKYHDIYRLRVVRAGLACLRQGLTTIIFCPSRLFAEEASKCAKRDAEQFGLDPNAISPYRSGYEHDNRREIEDGLRTGKFRLVFSTNALEIGIDVGRLDACILAGFPDSVMSAWQRIGRAGRAWDKTAYVLFFAMNNAIDQFFAQNVDAFLERPLDELIIGIDNDELIRQHVPYLLHESGWNLQESTRSIIGKAFFDRARDEATKARKPVAGPGPSYGRLSLRGSSGSTSRLIYKGKEIGSLSDTHVFREAYIGAVYNHLGKAYRVIAHGAGEIQLDDCEPHLRTEPRFYTVIQTSEILKGKRHPKGVCWYYGKVAIFENYVGHSVIDDRTGAILEDVPAERAFPRNVRAFWLSLEDALAEPGEKPLDGMRVLEQFFRIGSPFIVPCDRHDITTWTNTKPPLSVYLYETVPGGIGIAEKMLDVWSTVAEKGIAIAQNCPCTNGCPRCIHPPRYRSGKADQLLKAVGIRFATALIETVRGEGILETFDPDLHGWRHL